MKRIALITFGVLLCAIAFFAGLSFFREGESGVPVENAPQGGGGVTPTHEGGEITPTSGGNTYYVSPTGSNANPGTPEEPWASPGYACRRLSPGDTLVILSGTYVLETEEDMIIPPSGAENAWIRIIGENMPVLAGRGNLRAAIDLSGVSYVEIWNIEITHDPEAAGEEAYFRDGIEILGSPSHHIILRNIYIHHIDEMGLNIQDVDGLQILDSRIEYCGFGGIGGPAGERGGLKNILIRGCTLSYSGHYYQGVIGRNPNNPYDRPDGFGIEPSDGPVQIVDTVVEHNFGDGIDSKAKNTLVSRCVVANNSCDGVKLWGSGSRVESTLIYGRGDGDPTPTPWAAIVIDQVVEPDSTFEIVNVTVDDALGNGYIMYVQYDNPEIPVSLLVRNSIFSGRGPDSPIYIGSASRLTADHNLFYFPSSASVLIHGDKVYGSSEVGELGEGNIYGDPLFVSPAWGTEGNYRLRAGSPAVDAGIDNGAPAFDLNGIERPRGTAYDIGAYEM